MSKPPLLVRKPGFLLTGTTKDKTQSREIIKMGSTSSSNGSSISPLLKDLTSKSPEQQSINKSLPSISSAVTDEEDGPNPQDFLITSMEVEEQDEGIDVTIIGTVPSGVSNSNRSTPTNASFDFGVQSQKSGAPEEGKASQSPVASSSSSSTETIAVVKDSSVSRALECPVCLEVPVELRIYNCTMGHSICENCYDGERPCHSCKSPFNGGRNFLVEGLIKIVPVKCKYSDCGVVMKGEKIAEHLKTCDLRPIVCNDIRLEPCNGVLINCKKFKAHLMEKHGIEPPDTILRAEFIGSSAFLPEGNFKMDQALSYIQYEDHLFLRNMEISKGILYCWMTMVGKEETANKYYSRITIVDSFKPLRRQASWGHMIHSAHHNRSELQDMGDCAMIPVAWLKPYLSQALPDEGADGFRLAFYCSVAKASSELTMLHAGEKRKSSHRYHGPKSRRRTP